MARRDIRINSKGFIVVFVSPYCNKKHKGWISVFVNHIKSVKICVNLWEPSNRPATGQATAIFALQIYRISTTKRFPHVGNIFRIKNTF